MAPRFPPLPRIRQSTISPSQLPLLQTRLAAELPYTLPLARRIEFHLAHPISETARIFVAVALPGLDGEAQGDGVPGNSENLDNPWLDLWLQKQSTPQTDSPWVAAHIDLENQGQTQIWVYASWENPDAGYFSSSLADLPSASASASTSTSGTASTPTPAESVEDPRAQTHTSLFYALFRYIHKDLVPLQPTAPNEDWLELKRTGKYLSTPYSRDKVLFGTLHEVLAKYFDNPARTRTDSSYLKYVFTLPPSNPSRDQEITGDNFKPPEGYYLADMLPEHLQMVLDRTPVPRTLSLLLQFVSVGLFFQDNPIPIGWGFLSKDGSLASLHTEPEHRGKGLAVVVGYELLRRGKDGHEDKHGVYYGHADVSESNLGSRRVMEKLGGIPRWRIGWTEINLGVLLRTKKDKDGIPLIEGNIGEIV